MNYERYIGDATLQVNAYTGRRSVIQYLSIPGTIPAGKRGGVVAFDRKFYGGSVHWLQPINSAPGDLTLIAGLDYDRSQDDRQGYSNTANGVQGVKGALGRDETDTATSLDPFVQANWLLGDWTLQAGLRHNTMKMDVDDRFVSGTDGDDSGSRPTRRTPHRSA